MQKLVELVRLRPILASTRKSLVGVRSHNTLAKFPVLVIAWFLISTPNLVGEEKSKPKYEIPVWHPDVLWEVDADFAGCNAPGFLDGPRRESQPFGREPDRLYGPTQGGRNLILAYDEKTEWVHIAAGSARGFLDGPFSRARFGLESYNARSSWAHSPDKRYYYMTDVSNNHALRRLDLQEQQVKTIRRNIQGFGGFTVDDQGKVLLIEGKELLWLDPDGKKEKSLGLTLEESISGIGGWGASLAYDEINKRLYATAFGSKNWYVWYWDLKDGSFHGVLPIPPKDTGRRMNEAGPFEGTRLYNEGTVFFGPDDPKRRFLYIGRVDTDGLFRLDLEKKIIAALTLINPQNPKGQKPQARFIEEGMPARVPVYATMRFTEEGNIVSWRVSPFVATQLKRIK